MAPTMLNSGGLGCFSRRKSQQVYLSTFAGLDSARHLYEKCGFKLLEENEGNTWGVRVREQVFEWVR